MSNDDRPTTAAARRLRLVRAKTRLESAALSAKPTSPTGGANQT